MKYTEQYEIKTVRLSRIKIADGFSKVMPTANKLKDKYSYYRKYGRFTSPIVLDRHNTLTDGYCTYLIAKMFGIKKMDVMVERRKNVFKKWFSPENKCITTKREIIELIFQRDNMSVLFKGVYLISVQQTTSECSQNSIFKS